MVCVGHADSEVVDELSIDVSRVCELLSDTRVDVELSALELMLMDTIVPADDVAAVLLGVVDSLVLMAPDTVVEASEDTACEEAIVEDAIVPVCELEALIVEEDWVITLEDLTDELDVPVGDEVPLLWVVEAIAPLDI